MTLTLAPKSQRVFEKSQEPRSSRGIVGQPGSFFFTRRGLSIVVLHSSVNCTTSVVGSALLFPRISLIYLVYVGTYVKKRYIHI